MDRTAPLFPVRFEVQVEADPGALSRAAARLLIARAHQSIQKRGLFTVCLSGGSTPRPLYHLLATDSFFQKQVPWDQVHLFWGDERHVPPDHPDSNYRMVRETLLSKVPIPLSNVHPIPGQNPEARQAAASYEEDLRHFFHLTAGTFPLFDFVLLGMGTDGHTAALFPGTEALQEEGHLVVANWVEKLQVSRITLTIPVFNRADFILFVVDGAEKAEILKAVLEGKRQGGAFPAQLIQPDQGRLVWLVDKAAGHLLQKR